MDKINSMIQFFQNMTQEKIIDIVIALIIIGIFCLVSSAISYLIIKIFKWKEKDKTKIKANAFYHPVKAAIIVLGIYLAILMLNLPKDVMGFLDQLLEIIIICIVAKGLSNIFAPNSLLMQKIEESNRVGNKTLAGFIGKIAKAVIYIGAGILIITNLGYNLNGIIAGLGVGSVVVALAAQDLAKSLIAGASILLDKPFVVGDFIQTKTYEGTVVDITFRSTKIKTADDTIVTVPNSKLAEEAIVNYAKIEKRRYNFNLKLPLQTNTDTIETIINRIKFVLVHNKDIIEDTIVIGCNSILEDGINITVSMYTNITPYADYLNFRTNVNEAILNIVDSEGIRLSNPSQDVYVYTQENKEE